MITHSARVSGDVDDSFRKGFHCRWRAEWRDASADAQYKP